MFANYGRRVRDAFAAVLTPAWWHDVTEASVRQAQQVLIPFLGLVIATGQVDTDALTAAAVAFAGGEIVVVGRRLAALTAPDGASLSTVVVVRAASAFAGSVVGSVLAVDAAHVLDADWRAVIVTGIGAAGLALVAGKADPPASIAARDAVAIPLDRTA